MDLDQIIVLIIVMVIWGVSNAIRMITNPDKEKKSAAKKKPGFFEILQQNLAALEERATGGEGRELDEHLQSLAQPEAEEQEIETLIDKAEDVSPKQEPTRADRGTVSASPPAVVTQPRPVIHVKTPMAMISRSKLKDAVIWAEILAPPLGMRENEN